MNDSAAEYKSSRITFTEVENQWDIQLNHAISISQFERLIIMKQLTDRAFGINSSTKNNSFKGSKLIFGSYE